MHLNQFRNGLIFATIAGALVIPSGQVYAADEAFKEFSLPGAGIEAVLNNYDSINLPQEIEKYLVPSEKGEFSDMAFANVDEGSYLYIRSEPTQESEWVGKLYKGYASNIVGPVGQWTKVESGSVTGYVKTDYILTGLQAEQTADELAGQNEVQEARVNFQYAESKEEELVRVQAQEEQLARETAERAAAEQEAMQTAIASGNGQSVVDYACQFIGNPYVWGGTDLNNGADCSGFIQSVYANFGVDMPRTSGEMRNAGVGVSYEEAQPGDVICYNGHVGIYMGGNQIVNAIDESNGIGISNATFTNIITVRRLI